jgi:hypothetical protein
MEAKGKSRSAAYMSCENLERISTTVEVWGDRAYRFKIFPTGVLVIQEIGDRITPASSAYVLGLQQ